MINNISSTILNIFIKNGAISDEFELYRYGIEVIVSNSLGMMGIMLIAIINNLIIEAIIFIVVFAKVRSYIGGYHCKTYLNCNIAYIISFLVFILFGRYFNNSEYIIVTIIAFIAIIIFGPVDHFNKRLTDSEKGKYKKLGIIYFILFVFCSLIFSYYLKVFQYALIMSAFLMVIGREKNKYESIKSGCKIF